MWQKVGRSNSKWEIQEQGDHFYVVIAVCDEEKDADTILREHDSEVRWTNVEKVLAEREARIAELESAVGIYESQWIAAETDRDKMKLERNQYMESWSNKITENEVLEADRDRWKALAAEIRTKADAEWWESRAAEDWLVHYDAEIKGQKNG